MSSEQEPLLVSKKEGEKMTTADTGWQLLRIAGVFAPLIVFWGIFFQQNSTWVLQGRRMDCYLGSLHVPPGITGSLDTENCLTLTIFVTLTGISM